MVRQVKKATCPSCGASIHLRYDRYSMEACPKCGEWLVQHGWLGRRLVPLDEETTASAFDESDEWEREIMGRTDS